MRIPVFVSTPNSLDEDQTKSKNIILEELEKLQLEARTLGNSDYPADLPINEVYSLAVHCSGGVILGFTQFETNTGIWKKESLNKSQQNETITFPTPWNQLEAGILFGLSLPVLVFKEENISGGIFDLGAADIFVQTMPIYPVSNDDKEAITQIFLKWGAKVRNRYYQRKI
jgi:hypothetical protein